MTTRVTLKAVVNVNFLTRVPAFALRQLASGDERMPVAIAFDFESQAWPREHVQIGCDRAEDVIVFVRELAKDELKRRGEPLSESGEILIPQPETKDDKT